MIIVTFLEVECLFHWYIIVTCTYVFILQVQIEEMSPQPNQTQMNLRRVGDLFNQLSTNLICWREQFFKIYTYKRTKLDVYITKKRIHLACDHELSLRIKSFWKNILLVAKLSSKPYLPLFFIMFYNRPF